MLILLSIGSSIFNQRKQANNEHFHFHQEVEEECVGFVAFTHICVHLPVRHEGEYDKPDALIIKLIGNYNIKLPILRNTYNMLKVAPPATPTTSVLFSYLYLLLFCLSGE